MLPSTLSVLSLNLLAGIAVSAMRVRGDDFGRARRALIFWQFNPANINAACHSLCNVPIETINACTTLSCACTGPTVGALVKCVDCSVSLSPTAAHQEEGQVYLNNIHAICLAGGYNIGPLKVTISSVAESSTSAASSGTSAASSGTSAASSDTSALSSSTSAASSSTPAAPSGTASSAPSPDSTSAAFSTLTAPAGGSSPSPSSVGSTTPSPPASSPAPSSGSNPGTFGGAAGQTSADASVRDFSVLVLAGSVVLGAVAVF